MYASLCSSEWFSLTFMFSVAAFEGCTSASHEYHLLIPRAIDIFHKSRGSRSSPSFFRILYNSDKYKSINRCQSAIICCHWSMAGLLFQVFLAEVMKSFLKVAATPINCSEFWFNLHLMSFLQSHNWWAVDNLAILRPTLSKSPQNLHISSR